MKKNKKKEYQKETTFFMGIWMLILSPAICLNLVDIAFGETIKIKSTLIDILYFILFCFGYYFAKKGKLLAGIIELVTGGIIMLNDIISDGSIGLYGIFGILVIIHAIVYMYYFKKNKKSK